MNKELNRPVSGLYWRYNVYQNDTPVKEFGKVVYTIDNYGNAILVQNNINLNVSLAN